MLMVVTNDGKLYFLRLAMQTVDAVAENLVVGLYQNDYTPVDTSHTSDFDAATFGGYSEVGIGVGEMTAPIIVSDVAQTDCAFFVVFTHTGGPPQIVYGWYLRGDSSGQTYLAQRFDAPRNMVPGANEALDPFRIKLKTFA